MMVCNYDHRFMNFDRFQMKQIMKFSSLVLIVLVFLVNSCELLEPDHKIAFVNNSDSDVYCRWSSHYPDTLIIQYEAVVGSQCARVSAHSSVKNIIPGLYDWVTIIEESIPSDTLLIFVLDASTMDSIGGKQVDWISLYNTMDYKQLYDWLVMKHYTLSLEDLERMNWTVTYP